MPISPDTMRTLLVACLVVMALLAILYLRQRELSTAEYLAWGLLIVLLPFLGPFLVIWLHPGSPRRFARSRIRFKSGSAS
jgi:F0F1-type ATP synthase assembly protein I